MDHGDRNVGHAGLDLPLVTGRFTAVTGLTGLDRLRYRLPTVRVSNFEFEFQKLKIVEKNP
jgi:hypothetical protein